jgi:hypothetical protein
MKDRQHNDQMKKDRQHNDQRRTDNTMTKRRTDNTMTKRKTTKGDLQNIHIKLKIE